MFITADNTLGFIHITKTGGTSVVSAFKNISITHVCRTHALYGEYKDKSPTQWFATMRHPAARLHSGYYYQLEWDYKRYIGELPLKSDLTKEFLQERIDLFKQYGFVNTVISNEFKNKYNILKEKYNIKSVNVLEQMQSICKYISGCENIKLFDIETQSADLFNWIRQYYPKIEYTHIHQTKNKKPWNNEVTSKLKEYIEINYSDDLNFFGYQL